MVIWKQQSSMKPFNYNNVAQGLFRNNVIEWPFENNIPHAPLDKNNDSQGKKQ